MSRLPKRTALSSLPAGRSERRRRAPRRSPGRSRCGRPAGDDADTDLQPHAPDGADTAGDPRLSRCGDAASGAEQRSDHPRRQSRDTGADRVRQTACRSTGSERPEPQRPHGGFSLRQRRFDCQGVDPGTAARRWRAEHGSQPYRCDHDRHDGEDRRAIGTTGGRQTPDRRQAAVRRPRRRRGASEPGHRQPNATERRSERRTPAAASGRSARARDTGAKGTGNSGTSSERTTPSYRNSPTRTEPAPQRDPTPTATPRQEPTRSEPPRQTRPRPREANRPAASRLGPSRAQQAAPEPAGT